MADAMLSRERAWALVTEHVQSESLRKHLLAVEAAVRGYARAAGEDEDAWGFVALVHDFDYEKFPDRENHPYRGVELLKSLGYPEWVTRAILSHADYSGVTRESQLEKTLFACDELSGFITAAALVRPSKSVLDLEASSVIKRMKDKAFARAVPREDIRKGAEELGLPLETHITNVIGFLRERAEELGHPRKAPDGFRVDSRTAGRSGPYIVPARLHGRFFSRSRQSERGVRHQRRATRRQCFLSKGAVGLLGPNGAGKSTMLKALLGFLTPKSGRLEVLGLNVAERPLEVRARLGYMPESDGHIPGMNAVTFVGYCGQLAGLPKADAMQRAHEVLYYVGLGEARYRKVEEYSTGMKQRIKLAQALVHDPDLLFLDEPTNGMDPKGRDEMLELIRDLAHNKGVDLILSSHLLPDVEYTCDHVVVLDKGTIAASGSIDQLKGPAGRVFEVRVKGELAPFIAALSAAGMECQETEEDVMRVFVPGTSGARGEDQRRICEFAKASGAQVRHLRASLPTLEDVFARAIGEP